MYLVCVYILQLDLVWNIKNCMRNCLLYKGQVVYKGPGDDCMQRWLGLQCQSLNNICNQLMMLITLSRGVNPHVEAPSAVTNAVVAPLNPLNTTTHQLKPATPSEFLGDHMKGCAFLNSCDLYIGLVGHDMGNPWVYFGVPAPIPTNTIPKQGTGAVFPWVSMVYCGVGWVPLSFCTEMYIYYYC